MRLDGYIHYAHLGLMPGVELYVYAVEGERYSVLIDTGIKSMRENLLTLCQEVANIQYVLITHAHADHIGCNAAVREATGARFAAAGALAWIEDLEIHYAEFCRVDALPDSPGQRREIMDLMDGPVPVDFVLTEGMAFRLGDEVELTTLALPGHKLEEVGFLELRSGTLFMGDVLLALKAPFFHGFQTARGFHRTLDRLEHLISSGQVTRVLSSHHQPLSAEETLTHLQATREALLQIEIATLEAATGVDFRTLWQTVCQRLSKVPEFRGYTMLEAYLRELAAEGRIHQEGSRFFRL